MYPLWITYCWFSVGMLVWREVTCIFTFTYSYKKNGFSPILRQENQLRSQTVTKKTFLILERVNKRSRFLIFYKQIHKHSLGYQIQPCSKHLFLVLEVIYSTTKKHRFLRFLIFYKQIHKHSLGYQIQPCSKHLFLVLEVIYSTTKKHRVYIVVLRALHLLFFPIFTT